VTISPLISLISIEPASAAVTVLTSKWTRSGLGTNWEGGVVLGDVTGDGVDDVVYGGNDNLVVLDGITGSTIASYAQTRIGQYCQPQCYDVDGDGVLDILVPLYYLPGLAAVKYDGDSTLQQLWIVNTEGTSGSGSVMAKPVAGDIDGDGKLDIFIASQDVSPGGYYDEQGRYTYPNGYDGTVCRIDASNGAILAQTFTWRPCSGGLSLADTDNDGVFELYQGDRGMYYSDGGYGGGEKSWWAENLTLRWSRQDALTSSQAPALADVNNDGILDVVTGMYNEMSTLNSSNGQWINHFSSNTLSVHYGITVYDIDADGHLDLLTNDGDHDNQNYTDIFDLVTGQLKAQLPLGNYNNTQPYDNKWAPLVADIYPNGNNPDGSPRMEIITGANTSRTTTYTTYPACLLIFDNQYNLLQNITGLSNQIGYPIVQDIDNDGFLELIAIQNNGVVRAYDTSSPAPAQRIRSEVTYYSEKRTGTAVYEPAPWAANYWTTPLLAPIYPADNTLKIPQSTTSLSFKIRDHQSLPLTYTITTSPDIGSASGSSTGNSYNWQTQTLTFNKALAYDTTYTWTVSVSDGTHVTQRTYSFRTELAPNQANSLPTQSDPTVTPQNESTSSTFTATSQNTVDGNGDPVTNTYLWSVNGQQVANLVLPFNTRNEVNTKDYTDYGNDGIVTGATWVPNGKVGGAYSFDGKDDAIVISDGGAGYYDNKTYSTYNPELGGDGTWTEISVEAWINLSSYNNGSRIVAKIPSYEIGFESNYNGGTTTRLMASVWPHTGVISTDDNHAASDRARTVSATVNLELNTWYHIAFTYESGVGIKLYLNGVMVAQTTGITGVLEVSSGAPVYIGRLVQPFAGLIDEVQIYPHALSADNINSHYQCTKDGLSTNSVFCPAGIAAPGDTLTCTVIPSDSYGDGTARSASVTLLNSPPVASDLKIYPTRAGNARLDGETLGAIYTYFDPDGQLESGSQIRWYMNGVLQAGLNEQRTVPASTTQIGQTWYYTVTPRDSGGASGDTQTSPTVTIRANTAPVTGTPTLTSTNGGTAYDDEELTATAAATTDTDNDATTNIYHWTRNGVSQTNLQMPFDTEVPTIPTTNGAVKDYSGYNNNGAANGSTWVQNGILGGALSFDGNDYITVQENANSLGGSGSWSQMSIEFWIKASGQTTSTQTVVLKPDAAYAPGVSSYGLGYRVQYRYYADSYRVYWNVGSGTNSFSVNSRIYGTPDQWHHIVCTYQSGVGLKIFTDGLLSGTLAATGDINATMGSLLYIGGINSGLSDFMGQMDEVRIYPTALSAAQVFQRYVDTLDGVNDSETIVPQETSVGDNWMCQVTPNDAWGDGTTVNSQSLTIAARSTQPHIDWYSPANAAFNADTVSLLNFTQVSSGTALSYSWTLDGVEQAATQNWTYTPTTGTHHIRVTVTSGGLSDYQEWTVNAGGVPPAEYTLTVNVIGSGSVTKNPDQATYTSGSSVQLTATPAAGWAFSGWSGDLSGSTNPTSITMNGNKGVTATFTENPPTQYTLTVSIVGSGSVTKNPDQATYASGTVVTLTPVAAIGYTFSGWSGDLTGNANPATITMNSNKAVTATFTESPPIPYTLTFNVVGSGSVTKNPDQVTYPSGTTVELTAEPADGWTFAGWSGDLSGMELTKTIDMTSNKVVTATFEETQLFVFQDGFESGSFSAWSATTNTAGETSTIASNIVHTGANSAMFTSDGGLSYERAYASRSGLSLPEINARAYVYVDQSGIVDNADRFYVIQIMGGYNIVAYGGWRQDSSGNLHWHLMIRDGTSYVGAYSASTPSTDTWYLIELHWKADTTAGFGELYVNGELVASITGRNTANYGSATILRAGLPEIYNCAATTVYIDDVTVSQGSIDPPPQYSLTVNTVGSGSVTKNPDQATYASGSSVQLTATPAAGWAFSGWSGDLSESANPASITMDSNKEVTATFELLPTYTLTVNVVGSGSVTKNPDQPSYVSGTTVQLTANPATSWVLSSWTGDASGSATTIEVTMDANKIITATFIESTTPTYTLTINIVGQGEVTKNPDLAQYTSSTQVTLTPQAASGWEFSGWSGDLTGNTYPATISMTSDKTVTATFTAQSQQSILEDGFESGNFGAWTTTSTGSSGSGETLSITSSQVYSGVYAASFSSNGDGGYEKAYLAETLDPTLSTVYVQGVFCLTQNGIVENGDKIKLIELRAGSSIIAAAGVIERSGTLRWWLETRDGTSWIETYSTTTTADLSAWTTIELQWINDAANGGATLLVNDATVLQVTGDNTSNYGSCTQVRMGLAELYNCGATTLLVDDVVISEQEITT
jgi:uncharacterized repeat protein (TIGR02543 family)